MKKIVVTALMFFMLASCIVGCGKAGKYNDKGLELYNDGSYEEAVVQFDTAIEEDGDNAEYYVNKAYALVELSRYDEAYNVILKALDYDDESKDVYRVYGIVLLGRGDYAGAIDAFNSALSYSRNKINDFQLDILKYRAVAETKRLDYDSALQSYTSVIAADKDDESAYYLRGTVYLMAGDYDRAVEDYDRAVALDEDDITLIAMIAEQLTSYSYEDKASEYLEIAKELMSVREYTSFEEGRIYYQLGDYESAISSLTESYEGGEFRALFYLGETYMATGDYNSAIEYFSNAIENNINICSSYNERGVCRMNLSQYDEALADFTAGIAIGTDALRELLKNQITAYEHVGDFESAKAQMAAFLEKYPDDEQALLENEFLQTR